jgi:ATP-dependent Clp protease ATP-binding subunit ClpC
VFKISPAARQAIMRAQDEAIGLGDDFVGTEHLLRGLAGVPEGVAPRPACDEAAKAAIEQPVAQAETLGQDYVGTGHMLLGMLATGDNAAGRILGSVGLGEPNGRTLVADRTQAIRE